MGLPAPTGGWPAAMLVAVAGVLTGVAASWGVSHHRVGLIIVMGLVAACPFVVRAVQGRWDPFEPVQIVAIAAIVLFVARPVAEIRSHLTIYGNFLIRPGFTTGIWITIIGVGSLYAGYFSGVGRRLASSLKPLPDVWDRDRAVRFSVKTLVVAVFLTAGYVGAIGGLHIFLEQFKGRNGSTGFILVQQGNAYFAQGSYLVIPVSFMLLAAWNFRRSAAVGLLLAATVATALLETVRNGDRTFILQLLMPLIVMWFLRRDRRPRVPAIAIAILLSIIGANVLVEVRNVQTRSRHPLVPTVISAITHPTREISNFMTGADPSEFSVLEVEANQLKRGGILHFHPGATIESIAVGPIPRHLIGTKPRSGLEQVVYGLFPYTQQSRGSFGSSWLGDLYDDDGWLTVVLFDVLIGIGLRTIWEYFERNRGRFGMQLAYASLLPQVIVLMRNNLTDAIARSVFMVAPVALCMIVCSRPPRGIRKWLRRHPPEPSPEEA